MRHAHGCKEGSPHSLSLSWSPVRPSQAPGNDRPLRATTVTRPSVRRTDGRDGRLLLLQWRWRAIRPCDPSPSVERTDGGGIHSAFGRKLAGPHSLPLSLSVAPAKARVGSTEEGRCHCGGGGGGTPPPQQQHPSRPSIRPLTDRQTVDRPRPTAATTAAAAFSSPQRQARQLCSSVGPTLTSFVLLPNKAGRSRTDLESFRLQRQHLLPVPSALPLSFPPPSERPLSGVSSCLPHRLDSSFCLPIRFQSQIRPDKA